MDAGKVWYSEIWDLNLDCTFNVTNPNNTSDGKGIASTSYTTSTSIVTPGIILQNITSQALNSYYSLEIPDLSVSLSQMIVGFLGTMSSKIRFYDLAIYAIKGSGVFRVTWSGWDWFTTSISVPQSSGSASSIDGLQLTPAGLPIFGIPGKLEAYAVLGIAYADFPPSPQSTDTNHTWYMESIINGGWDYKRNGVWVAPDTVLEISEELSPGCSACQAIFGDISTTNTNNGNVSAIDKDIINRVFVDTVNCACPDGYLGDPSIYDIYFATRSVIRYNGTLTLIPNLSKTVNRMNSDYLHLITKGSSPETLFRERTDCFGDNPDGGGLDTTKHESTDTFDHATVTYIPDTLEDIFGYTTICPYELYAFNSEVSKTFAVLVHLGVCNPISGIGPDDPPISPPPCWDNPSSICLNTRSSIFPICSGSTDIDFLQHDEYIPLYLNTICCPHYLFISYFPEDGSIDWGTLADPSDYWLPIGVQWDSLVSQKRNHLVTAPLLEGGFATFIKDEYNINQFSSWWGISKFDVYTPIIPSSITLDSDSSSQWSFTGCTGTFGSDLVLNPSVTSIIAKYRLGNLTDKPWEFPHVFDHIYLNWSSFNISAINIFLVSIDGTKKLIATTVGTYDKPIDGVDIKYAGSWAQDNGAGIIVDLGSDSLGSGISTASLADSERVSSFKLLSIQDAEYLQYEIEVLDTSDDITLHYPIFYYPHDKELKSYAETRSYITYIWPDGVGIRFGQQQYYALGSYSSTPSVNRLGWKPTVSDTFAWAKEYLIGIDGDDNTSIDITNLYDSVEGNSMSDVSIDNIGVPLPQIPTDSTIRFAMINTIREVPPLAVFPVGNRDLTTWLETDTPTQEIWDWAQETRYIVSAKNQLHLFTPDGVTQLSTVVSSPPSSWLISKYSIAIGNTETTDYLLKAGSLTIAEVSPWHGYFSSRIPAELNLFSLINKKHRNFNHYKSDTSLSVTTEKQSFPPFHVKVFDFNILELDTDYKNKHYVVMLDGTTLIFGMYNLYEEDVDMITIDTDVINGTITVTKNKELLYSYYKTGGTLIIKQGYLGLGTVFNTTTTNITDIKDGSQVKVSDYITTANEHIVCVGYVNTSDAFVYLTAQMNDFTNFI